MDIVVVVVESGQPERHGDSQQRRCDNACSHSAQHVVVGAGGHVQQADYASVNGRAQYCNRTAGVDSNEAADVDVDGVGGTSATDTSRFPHRQ